jgi:hypothetical protein
MIGGYCRVGVMAEGWVEKKEKVDDDVSCISFDRSGKLMVAHGKQWNGLEFENEVDVLEQDCAGYYIVKTRDCVVLVRPDYTAVHWDNFRCDHIALFNSVQKAVYVHIDLYEYDYLTGARVVKFTGTQGVADFLCKVAQQSNGNWICIAFCHCYVLSPAYEILYKIGDQYMSDVCIDCDDKIVWLWNKREYNRIHIYTSDGRTQLWKHDIGCFRMEKFACSYTLSKIDGTLCILADHEIRTFKSS